MVSEHLFTFSTGKRLALVSGTLLSACAVLVFQPGCLPICWAEERKIVTILPSLQGEMLASAFN